MKKHQIIILLAAVVIGTIIGILLLPKQEIKYTEPTRKIAETVPVYPCNPDTEKCS